MAAGTAIQVLAHNGEINTIRGNQNWMSCHEDRMGSALFGMQIDDLKPVVAKGSSDSAALDAVFELLCGRPRPAHGQNHDDSRSD